MSYFRYGTKEEQAVYVVPCPKCEAKAGRPCFSSARSNGTYSHPHKVRVEAARALATAEEEAND